jgi:hypothetical protein
LRRKSEPSTTNVFKENVSFRFLSGPPVDSWLETDKLCIVNQIDCDGPLLFIVACLLVCEDCLLARACGHHFQLGFNEGHVTGYLWNPLTKKSSTGEIITLKVWELFKVAFLKRIE